MANSLARRVERNRLVSATLRLNPHPSKTEECGTRKFNGVRLGGVVGYITHPEAMSAV
jgi:hypothetical protein